jgi:hypothetical protein
MKKRKKEKEGRKGKKLGGGGVYIVPGGTGIF